MEVMRRMFHAATRRADALSATSWRYGCRNLFRECMALRQVPRVSGNWVGLRNALTYFIIKRKPRVLIMTLQWYSLFRISCSV